MRADARQHVAVIGSGAVGIISALELLRDGHEVTVIDPGSPGGEQAASYGNAGWFSSHSVIPPAEPGAWKKVPKYLADPLGPLTVRWGYLPKALPWLIRYLWSGATQTKIEATAVALRALLKDAPQLHQKLADEAGVGELVERQGLLHIYPSRAAFEADSFGWAIRKRVGVEWLELSRDELRQRPSFIRATPSAFWSRRRAAVAIPVLMSRRSRPMRGRSAPTSFRRGRRGSNWRAVA